MDDDGNWEDLQDPSIPMDSKITLTAEGDEVKVLQEMLGVYPILGPYGATDWCMLNLCPACQYKVEDEPPLIPAIEGSMDGGQSLRQVAMQEDLEEDLHVFDSSYLISEEDVDQFKHDVKLRAP
ncbi:hypothetical protein PILCRDRAFT_11129 [Piloderma croceum F 1598]|uniref:Uncharacterized protein n=1 Tax=Piloderma croceum (strain F 1598) TaxID=765440 RepID=A0A0C3F0V8_PILCF|nr:hypothetical protein PILCRDRAFT_11129 [Piloderma croceum F 1598]